MGLKVRRLRAEGWEGASSIITADLRRDDRAFARIIDYFEDLLYLRDPDQAIAARPASDTQELSQAATRSDVEADATKRVPVQTIVTRETVQ